MSRLRVRFCDWPVPALVLTDTPRPTCQTCEGSGGWEHHSVDHEGEYAGTDYWPCDCWDSAAEWCLLRLPRRLARLVPAWRRRLGGYSTMPPF